MYERDLVFGNSSVIVRYTQDDISGKLSLVDIALVTDAIDFAEFCNQNDDWFELIEQQLY